MEPGDKMTYQELEDKLNAHPCLQPAVIIREMKFQEIGIAICLGENLAKKWQSGDVIVFWPNGDHTTMNPEDEIEIERIDLYESD